MSHSLRPLLQRHQQAPLVNGVITTIVEQLGAWRVAASLSACAAITLRAALSAIKM